MGIREVETYVRKADELPREGWQKSSFSADAGNCVEVQFLPDGTVAVRHSKNPHGPALIYSRREWDAFRKGVKAGQFRQ
jgi:hypothetical protein